MPEILRGSALMIFSTSTLVPSSATSNAGAFMPIMVSMQLASAVAVRSVGENRSPFPLLSVGASVSMMVLERRWVATVLKLPSYVTEEVIIYFCPKFTLVTSNQIITVKKLFVAAALLFSSGLLFAQSKEERREERKEKINALMRQEEEGVLIYNKQTTFGIQLRSNGYGAFIEWARMKNRNYATLYQVEFAEIKHPKENKDQFLNNSSIIPVVNNPIIYAKQNYFYTLKFGYGQSRRIGDKGNKNGVAVNAVYLGGLSLGLMRPYYVSILDSQSPEQARDIKYGENAYDDAAFVGENNNTAIEGGSGLGKGWGEIKIRPGAYAKGGLRFDYGRFNEVVSALEVGLYADFYAQKVPIMVDYKADQLFFGAYLAIEFGKRK